MTFVFSQVASDHAYTGADAMGVAGAVTANNGSPSGIFHNPAGLAEMESSFVILGNADILGVPFTYAGGGWETPKFGTVAFSYQKSSVTAGSATLSEEIDLGFSNGFYLQKDKQSQLMAGYTIHMYSWSLGESAGPSGDGSDGLPAATGNAVGIDVGVNAVLRGKHRVGAWMKNINSPSMGRGESRQYLPQRLTVGIAYHPYKGLTTSLIFDRLLGQEKQVRGGVDYRFSDILIFRVGVQSNPNRMGAGFGIRYNNFSLDYGLLTHPVLPIVQQFTLGYNFK